MWWAGINGVWGSVSDAYDSFDETLTGDAGPINRTIGSGPVDTINWILSLQRLVLGAQGAEWLAKSSSLDEPLTPTNFNLKTASTQGSGAVDPIKIDQGGVFVNRSGTRVYELAFDDLRLHRVHGIVVAGNHLMVKWQKFLGMKEEGRLRDHYLIDDAYQDGICLGMTEDEYRTVALPRMTALIRAAASEVRHAS